MMTPGIPGALETRMNPRSIYFLEWIYTGEFYCERNKNHSLNSHPKIWRTNCLRMGALLVLISDIHRVPLVSVDPVNVRNNSPQGTCPQAVCSSFFLMWIWGSDFDPFCENLTYKNLEHSREIFFYLFDLGTTVAVNKNKSKNWNKSGSLFMSQISQFLIDDPFEEEDSVMSVSLRSETTLTPILRNFLLKMGILNWVVVYRQFFFQKQCFQKSKYQIFCHLSGLFL